MKSFVKLIAAGLVLSSAAEAEDVNVYSYRQPELIKPLTDAFTEKTGIKVNAAYLKKGMVERMKAEGKRSPVDVMLTVDISRLAALLDAGLTQPVESALLEENVPSLYRDPGKEWFGLTTRARIVYASKERVAAGEVTTYEDLADPKWRGRLCTRSGTNAYNLARKPQGNDRAQVKAIWAGECDISIGNTYYMGKMLADSEQKAWADSVNVLFPRFENGGTHVNISGVAMAKYAPNRENALKFMEFLTSPDAQEVYATANYEYPIAPNTEPAELVKGWGAFQADDVNLMELAARRKLALKITEVVDFDG